MYASQQMLRVHHDEWLRHAEIRRLTNQPQDVAGASVRPRRRLRIRRPTLRVGRPLRHA
jgi:hypothetical protein